MECRDCGRLYDVPRLSDGARAKCDRCGATLHRFREIGLNHALAYTATGLICFAMANFLPFISLEMNGRTQAASLVTGIQVLYDRGLWELAAVVALTMLIAPFIQLLLRFLVLAGLELSAPPRWLPALYRVSLLAGRWAMIEVYLMGLLVAYVKLVDLATVDIGDGVYVVGLLMFLTVASSSLLDEETVWRAFENRGLVSVVPAIDLKRRPLLCEDCGLVSTPEPSPHGEICPRCDTPLHYRKPRSLEKTAALLVTGAVLYIPANLYPVMTVISLGKGAPATILGGVVELADAGMWPLAVLVFFASITVPVLKLVGLTVLVFTAKRRSSWRLRERTVFYRIIEFVGRWSMIDIFMISILVALVQLGQVATVEPGIGAIAFAAVVIITMIASESFDPRLMWDAAGKNKKGASR